MASLAPKRKKRLVLDIGTSCVRLCELSQTKSGYQLTKYLQKEFNTDPAFDEEERRMVRETALKEVLKTAKVKSGQKVIFGVPGQSVFTRTRQLPPVPEYKVSQIVKYEIQQQIPFSLDQIAMDYQVLDRTETGGYDVMMAAIKVDVVDKQVDILQSAKLNINIVDVNPIAAYNWLRHTGELGTGDCVALVDMGHSTTDIVIERENKFRFTRPLNIGGKDVTKAIAEGFGMSYADADKAKRERAFAPTGDAKKDGKVGEVLTPILSRYVSELMRSFSYFRSLPGGGPVNRVVLCGGGACLRGIVPYFQSQLGMEVRIAQPISGLTVTPGAQMANEFPEQSCVALGLALRNCEDVSIDINLVPPRIIEAARRREQAFYWVLIIVTVALIGASFIPQWENQNKFVVEQVGILKRYIGEYDHQLGISIRDNEPIPVSTLKQQYQTVKTQVEQLRQNTTMLAQTINNRRFWLDEFSLVNDARPNANDIWITSIESSRIGGQGQQNAGARPVPGRGSTAPKQSVPSTGFPGLEPAVQATGGRGYAAAAAKAGPTIPIPNGLVLEGYARTSELVKEYVDNLGSAVVDTPEESQVWVEKVHFNTADVEILDESVLFDTANYKGGTGADVPETRRVYTFKIFIELKEGKSKPAGPPDGAAATPRAAGAPGGGQANAAAGGSV